MDPLDFIVAVVIGIVLGACGTLLVIALFSSRQRDLPRTIALAGDFLREMKEIATGMLHALQILAGTRPKQ